MIIPIKCFTCGKVLADKYLFYLKEVKKEKIIQNLNSNSVIYLNEKDRYTVNHYYYCFMWMHYCNISIYQS